MIKTTFLILILITLSYSQQEYYNFNDYDETNEEICTLWNYLYPENDDQYVCTNNCHCDGKRLCIDNCCIGIARTAEDLGESENFCLNPQYYLTEENSQCTNSCDCDGRRFCLNGQCTSFPEFKYMCEPEKIKEIMTSLETQLEDKNEEELEEENCGCVEVITSLFDQIIDITEENQLEEQEVCQYLVDEAQGKAFSKLCPGGLFCDSLEYAFDAVSESTIDLPFVHLCKFVIQSLDKMGFQTLDLIQQLEDIDQTLDDTKYAIAQITCGSLMCSSQTQDQCKQEEKGGILISVFDAICHLNGDGESSANIIYISLYLLGSIILILI